MVDAGENINVTLKREFSEEAMNTLELPPEQVERVAKQVDQLFSHGVEVCVTRHHQSSGFTVSQLY